MINRIITITPNYPHRLNPENGIFVENLIKDWKKLGIPVDVIAPIKFSNILMNTFRKSSDLSLSFDKIVRPLYLTLSNKKLGPFDLNYFSRNQFLKAVIRGNNFIGIPSLYYGKFLLSGGNASVILGKMTNKPSFADLGESNLLKNINDNNLFYAKNIISGLTGIICVSERLKNEVVDLGARPEKCFVAPNSPDLNIFKPIDKVFCRKKLGLPENHFIVSFTGHFIERKGPLRVLKALELLSPEIKGVFLGKGPQIPCGDRVLHAGPVTNDQIPLWLNASDLFVLPTLSEGHCNAINEAIACGIPIVSSNIPDIKMQMIEDCGILVNPKCIGSISKAINALFLNEDKRTSCKESCIKLSQSIFKTSRGQNILNWLKKMMTSI